ncbi:hypothetical protein [Parabacteroides timonensis]|nr:hypothetical protein [Parabacteroides timonensis]
MERGKPVSLPLFEEVSEPQGKPIWGAGIGTWKKRMPLCNGADTD